MATMVKKGCTAIAKSWRAIAWKGRRADKNRVRITPGTVGIVVGTSHSKNYRWCRADIGGVIHTLHPWDWEFTSIRVGELRRWKDTYAKDALPFLVTRIVSLSKCECLGDGSVFGTSCEFLEDNSEVISETR
jgi:hypothetical protein